MPGSPPTSCATRRWATWWARKSFKTRILEMRAAFEGFQTEIQEVGGDDTRGFGRFTVTGRHTGEYLGYPATGNRIEFVGAVVAHARDGQLVEEWEYFDTATFLGQISS